jgi:hypothetical protein
VQQPLAGRELEGCFRIPHDNPPRWLFVLTAYLDESGQESNAYVFIAGFLGNDEQWKKCAVDWKAALGARKALHMNRLRWAYPKKVEKVLNRLGPIPYQCGLEALLGGVRVGDYEDIVKGTLSEKLMTGYIAALYPLVIQMLKVVPSNERVEIVFEAQERYETLVHIVLTNLTKSREPEFLTDDGLPKLANWSFASKASTMLTQPADFLAYAVTQIYRDSKSEKSRLCLPICPGGEKSTVIGAVMPRNQIRSVVQVTHTLVNLEKISGLNLKPQTPEQRSVFNKMVYQLTHRETP